MKFGDLDEIKRQIAEMGRQYQKNGAWRQMMVCHRLVRKLEQTPPMKRDMILGTVEIAKSEHGWDVCAKCRIYVGEYYIFCPYCGAKLHGRNK